MGNLYLLDSNTWMLTDVDSCNGVEKLSKKQREELGLFVMIHGDLTLSPSLYMPYCSKARHRHGGFPYQRSWFLGEKALLSM